jgi:hypothetical protein
MPAWRLALISRCENERRHSAGIDDRRLSAGDRLSFSQSIHTFQSEIICNINSLPKKQQSKL